MGTIIPFPDRGHVAWHVWGHPERKSRCESPDRGLTQMAPPTPAGSRPRGRAWERLEPCSGCRAGTRPGREPGTSSTSDRQARVPFVGDFGVSSANLTSVSRLVTQDCVRPELGWLCGHFLGDGPGPGLPDRGG